MVTIRVPRWSTAHRPYLVKTCTTFWWTTSRDITWRTELHSAFTWTLPGLKITNICKLSRYLPFNLVIYIMSPKIDLNVVIYSQIPKQDIPKLFWEYQYFICKSIKYYQTLTPWYYSSSIEITCFSEIHIRIGESTRCLLCNLQRTNRLDQETHTGSAAEEIPAMAVQRATFRRIRNRVWQA